MLRIKFKTIAWMLFVLTFLAFVVATQSVGKILYVNRTASMPIGLYIKTTTSNFGVGDQIIFNHPSFEGSLIKYVAAIGPSDWCVDEHAGLWADAFPAAQITIEKYPSRIPNQSECHSLAADELLALGDHPHSYDSRYFGPIKTTQVVAAVELFWQFK